MTENDTTEDPSPPPPTRLLRRSVSDRKVAGVCGGAGRWLDIDPLIFRVVIAVLAVFGAGVLLYGLAWLLVPEDGTDESEAQHLLHGQATASAVTSIVVVIVGLILFGGFVGDGPDAGYLVLLAVLAGGVLLAVRQGGGVGRPDWLSGSPGSPGTADAYGRQPGTAYSSTYVPAPSDSGVAYGPPRPPVIPPAPPSPPPPRRAPKQRSILGALTLSVAALTVGLLASWEIWYDHEVDVQVLLAAALGVVGLGLLVGTVLGRARGLIGVAALLTLVLVIVSSLNVPVRGDTGARSWAPVSVADVHSPYELAAGDIWLDLTGVDPTGVLPVEARVGAGELVVIVPRDVDVQVQAHVGVGNIDLPDTGSEGGLGVDRRYAAEADPGIGAGTGGSAGTIELDLEVGVGQLEVRREAA